MSDIQSDPFAVAFEDFRSEIDAVVRPLGVGAARIEVHHRRRRRAVAAGVAVAMAIVVPVAAFGITGARVPGLPFGIAGDRVRVTPSGPSADPSRPDELVFRFGAQSMINGTLTFVVRYSSDGGRTSAAVITTTGQSVSAQPIGSSSDVVTIGLAPDGTHMAFLGGGGLNVSDVDGANLIKLDGTVDRACGAPAWSPNSGLIVYGRGLGTDTTKIAVIKPDGTGRRILGTGCHPVFSVDGSQIAYVDDAGGLDVVNVDGSGHRVVSGKLGPAGIQTIMSFDHGHAVVDLGTGPCCDSVDVRHLRLIDPRLVDMATGAVTQLPAQYGTVAAAFYTKSGGMVLRVMPAADRPGKIVFLSPGGTETAEWDEPQLSLLGDPLTSLNRDLDLVGCQP